MVSGTTANSSQPFPNHDKQSLRHVFYGTGSHAIKLDLSIHTLPCSKLLAVVGTAWRDAASKRDLSIDDHQGIDKHEAVRELRSLRS